MRKGRTINVNLYKALGSCTGKSSSLKGIKTKENKTKKLLLLVLRLPLALLHFHKLAEEPVAHYGEVHGNARD